MSARPAVAPPPAWRFPAVRRSALANGLVIETVHLPGRPVAVAVLGLDVPLAAEPPGLDGALLAMAHTFAEGAGHLTSDELVSRLARVGATWFPGSGPDGPRLVVEVPTAGLGTALQLLAVAVAEPRFPADAVRRYATRTAAQLDAYAAGGTQVDVINAMVDPGHRMSRRVEGDADSLRALTSEALLELHSSVVGPDRATLIVVGDLSTVDVPALAERSFSGWAARARLATAHPAPVPRATPRLIVVERPGAEQTRLALGTFGPDRGSPDWPALTVAGHVLGFGATSLINSALRERDGYSYGFDTRLVPLRRGSVFSIAGAIRGDATPDALSGLLDILHRARLEGLDPARCESARKHLVRTMPLMFETPRAVAQSRAGLIGAGLSEDYQDAHIAAVGAVTPIEASEALARAVDPAALTLVVVGDPGHCDPGRLRLAMSEATRSGRSGGNEAAVMKRWR
ncbi:pitrilysin family protein [Catenulispora yoronensis]|uniref:M16 family metallopeptidase n=1 Tax=Catenulispora yoronensis TaxID=450799 RepID=UPI0031D285CB